MLSLTCLLGKVPQGAEPSCSRPLTHHHDAAFFSFSLAALNSFTHPSAFALGTT